MRRVASPVVVTLAALLLTGCLAERLADAEIDKRIEQESKPYPTPVLLADCLAEACKDSTDDCQASCMAGASEAARPLGEALWACWKGKCHEQTCKNVGDASCIPTCLLERCGDRVMDIIKSEEHGEDGCDATMACVRNRDPTKPGLFTRFGECEKRATADGKAALTTFAKCASATDGNIGKACHAELVACHSDTRSDDGQCYTFAGCYDACKLNGGGTACHDKCRLRLDASGRGLYYKLEACFSSGRSKMCREEVLNCIEPSGTQTCLDTYDCASWCSVAVGQADEIGCLYSCMHRTTPAAAAALMDLQACGAGGTEQTCAEAVKVCADPSGDKTCAYIQPCATTCIAGLAPSMKGNKSMEFHCVLSCLNLASEAAAAAFWEMLGCLQPCTNACAGDSDCEQQCHINTCKSQVQACAK